MKYIQSPLPYEMNALEPFFDKETLEIHYGKHHKTYADKCDAALQSQPNFSAPEKLSDLLKSLDNIPDAIKTSIRNTGGGHFNHEFFWQCLCPSNETKQSPSGKLLDAIVRDFGSFEAFKEQFTKAAELHFGSGWAWLIVGENGKLFIATTSNQDSPIMPKSFSGNSYGKPILTIDLWEHAYYLKYQNRRPEYIKNFWNVVNWDFAEKNFLN